MPVFPHYKCNKLFIMNLFHTQGQIEEFGTTQEIERELAIHRSFLDNQEKDAVVDNIKTSVCGSPLMVA